MSEIAFETPLLIPSPAGFRISYRGRDLLPSSAENAALKKVQSIEFTTDTLFVLCSPLLWYGVAELLKRLPDNATLVVIEVDPKLRNLFNWEQASLSLPDHAKLRISKSSKVLEICFDILREFKRSTRRVSFLSLNAGRLVNSGLYSEIQHRTELELLRFWRNRNTLLHMGPLWIRNLISNLIDPTERTNIAYFPRKSHIVLCGAGPSIVASIPLLRSCRGQVFIVAVDTALPILSAHHLIPDLVVALEGQIANLQDFIPDASKVPALAYDISSNPVVPRSCSKAKLWTFSSHFAEGKHWQKLEEANLLPTVIPPLGSVGVSALYLCQFIAKKQVYLTGLDFGFGPGLTHGVHSPSYLRYLKSMNRLTGSFSEVTSLSEKTVIVAGLNEQKIFTDPVLTSYRDSLNEVISYLVSLGLQLYDIRSSGLELDVQRLEDQSFMAMVAQDTSLSEDVIAYGKAPEDLCFFKTMAEDIENCMGALKVSLDHPGEENQEHDQVIISLLTKLDFLFYDLADREWPSLEPQALIRAYIKLGYFQNFITKRLNPHQS